MIAGLQALGQVCDVASLQGSASVHAHASPQPFATAHQILANVFHQLPAHLPASFTLPAGQPPAPHPNHIIQLDTLQPARASLATASVLTPGPWCALAPLWGNHFLPCVSIPGVIPGGLQSVPVPQPINQFHCNGGYIQPHVRTIADLLRAYFVLQQTVDQQAPHPWSPGDPSDAKCELAYTKALG
jgi:hypothetical protein